MTDSSIKVYGELLGSEDRTLRYRLLPFGSKGRTNVGLVTASADSIEIPEDLSHLVLNVEHDRMQPVGRFQSLEIKDDGIYASVTISKFRRGDEVLNLTASGDLPGISVEIAGAVISGGKIVGGELVAAAVCKTPAFSDALLMASDFGDIEGALEALEESVEGLKTALAQTEEAPTEEATEETETSEETPNPFPVDDEEELQKKGLTAMENSAIPTALTATKSVDVSTFETAVNLIASAAKNQDEALVNALNSNGITGSKNMFAALANVTEAASEGTTQPVWLDEIWLGRSYQRKYVPLMTNATLTGMKMEGWKFVQGPIVDDYSGFPAQVPSRAVITETWSAQAQRVAGGNSLDRIYKDLSSPSFLTAYYRAQAEQYAIKTDRIAFNHLVSSATTVTPGTVPTGVSATAAAIVDGALAILEDDISTPTAAIVPTSMYRDLLLARNDDSLQYLSSALGLEGGSLAGFSIVPSNDVTDVHVISKAATTFFEYGSTPIRVEVDTPANGGWDSVVFGYVAAVTLDNRGIVRVGATV